MELQVIMDKTQIFRSLADKMEKQEFDDEYLLLLIEFWQDEENQVDGNIFYARYALAHNNYEVAYEYAMKAFGTRKINWVLWNILRDCYQHQGNVGQAMLFAGFAESFYKEPVKIDVPRHNLEEALRMLSLGSGVGGFAPIARYKMVMGEQGITAQPAIYAGEFLPEMYPERPWHFWVGAYSEQEMLNYKGCLLEKIKDDPDIALSCAAEFVFDVVKSQEIQNSVLQKVSPGEEYLVPLAGMQEQQRVIFHLDREQDETEDLLGKWTYSYFRFNQDTHITSDSPFIMGKPVKLGHSPKRKKVILNILVDALCWQAVKERNYDMVPNMLAFFQKGIIFDEHRSVSEYTFPSLPGIETGLYPYHTQIFNEKASHAIDPRYETISEQMQKLGYYCVHILSNGNGIYTGSTRGYDREIINPYALHNYVGVERVIQHLEAFGECDQFLFMHTGDTHPWAAHTFQLPIHTQTLFDLKERSLKEEGKRASVYLPKRPLYLQWNEQCIRDMDRAFKGLFEYLESHYTEDEYIIQIYSDHGVPIYDDVNYVLSEHQTGAAYMMRGAGIPALGIVRELTSAVDIYPALAHCAGIPLPEYLDGNLPAALGGQQREYVVSMSLFPGSPFIICIRTHEWECRGISRQVVDEDGRANLDDMEISIYRRFQTEKIEDNNLRQYFAGIITKETAEINNHGRYWPDMRAARPEWFAEKE